MANVGYATLQIIPSTQGLQGRLDRDVSGAARGAGTRGGALMGGAMGGALSKAFAPLAAAAAGVGIGSMLKNSIGYASSLGESINAVNVTFGDAAKGVHDFANTSANALGLTKGEFNGLAVMMSSFAGQIAGPGGDVSKVIADLTTRAADFGSVLDIDAAQAMQTFQSGLAGETEPLKRFGINLSDAAIKTYAYANGIANAGAEMTEEQKVMARYGLLMEKTAKMEGDRANTAGSFANSTRELKVRWQEATGALATGLVPILERLNAFLLSAFKAGSPLRNLFSQISGAFSGAGGAGGALAGVMETLRPAIDGIKNAISDAGGVTGIFTRIWGTVGPMLAEAWAIIAPIFAQLKATIKTVFADAGPIVRALGAIFSVVFPLIWAQVKFYMTAIGNVIRGALKIIQGIVQIFSGLLSGDFSKVWEGIKNVVSGAFQALWGLFNIFLIGRILRLVGSFGRLLGGLFGSAMRGAGGLIMTGLRAIFGYFRSAPSMIVRGLANLAGLLGNVMRSAMSLFLAGARSGGNTVISFVRGLPGRIVSGIGNLGNTLRSAGADLLRGMALGISGAIGDVVAKAKEAAMKVVNGVKGALGIKSPSRVFMQIGAYTAEGMALGIEKGSPRVSKAMNALTALPAGGAAFSGSVGASGGPGGGLIGSLTIQSSGNVRDDLGEVEFMLRRINRGGTYA